LVIGEAPAQITQMILRPGLSFERVEQALRRRGEVGGVSGAYSSAASVAPVFASAALNGRNAVAPEGIVLRQRRDVTPCLPIATAFEIASCEELRAVRKM
jgi:hypothetical protein